VVKDVEHSGIKGMKWGVRRSRKELAKLRQAPSGDAREAHKALVKSKISGVEALSNKELQNLNNRLNLEQNYAKLSYQPSKLQKGLKAVKEIVGAGKTIKEANDFATSDFGVQLAANMGSKRARTTAAARAAAKAK
jgi:hypothetical protein